MVESTEWSVDRGSEKWVEVVDVLSNHHPLVIEIELDDIGVVESWEVPVEKGDGNAFLVGLVDFTA